MVASMEMYVNRIVKWFGVFTMGYADVVVAAVESEESDESEGKRWERKKRCVCV
jgi:hypothetical protein